VTSRREVASTFENKYLELFNRGPAAVAIDGWSVARFIVVKDGR
jgi:hypothetical protein